MTSNPAFNGRWTFAQGAAFIRIDPTTGEVSIGAPPTADAAKFNAYGSDANFILQGANGLYVVATASGYSAIKNRNDPLNQFALALDNSGQFRIVDLGVNGAGPQFYLNANGGKIAPIAKNVSPPATTLFAQTIVTPSLATILSQGFTSSAPDLAHVDFSGVDFTKATANLDFTTSELSCANFSNTKFSAQTAFDQSSAQHAIFVGANLENCSIGGVDFTNADFTHARLDGISADHAIFSHATLTGASFNKANNLAHAVFDNTKCQNVDFRDTLNILNTDFTGADLTDARFTGASVTGDLTIHGANLTGAALNNSATSVTIYPGFLKIDGATNFTAAQLQYLDFTSYNFANMIFAGADLTGCKLVGVNFTGVDLSYATLDGAALTGTVLLNGANLSNASLKGADLTNAQLGSLSGLFSIASGESNYAEFLKALRNNDVATVKTVFDAHHYTLAGAVTITPSRFSDTTWTVEASASATKVYTVMLQTIGGVLTLVVYTPTTPAVLSNAFMANVTLTSANLIGVNASGASIYGVAGNQTHLNSALLQDAQFNNANLSNADFSGANLGGVNFDYAILTNAQFQSAVLTTSAGGVRASFIGADLQSANFDGATISNVTFANAALSIANPANPLIPAGVWLFAAPQDSQAVIVSELQAAAKGQFTLVKEALQQLLTPGPVGLGIVRSFEKQGVALNAAVLSIMGEGVYWQLADATTQYVIFQSVDSNATPSLGVAPGSSFTMSASFFLPLSLQGKLKNGLVDAAVIAAFKNNGVTISTSAIVSIAQHPTDWQIINGPPNYNVYTLWLSANPNGGLSINARPAIPNSIAAFNAASIALGTRATVTALSVNNGWNVSNDASDPFNPVINFITFNVIQAKTGAPLDVYGAALRIARLSGPGQFEYYNIVPGVTTLVQSQLASAGNVCPNGDFATTNQHNGLGFPQWLRARVAPRPPRCIPDPNGMYFCPN